MNNHVFLVVNSDKTTSIIVSDVSARVGQMLNRVADYVNRARIYRTSPVKACIDACEDSDRYWSYTTHGQLDHLGARQIAAVTSKTIFVISGRLSLHTTNAEPELLVDKDVIGKYKNYGTDKERLILTHKKFTKLTTEARTSIISALEEVTKAEVWANVNP